MLVALIDLLGTILLGVLTIPGVFQYIFDALGGLFNPGGTATG